LIESTRIKKKAPDRINVLSIDGGGIRGIIPATILAEIEAHTGKHISQLFDIIAGTSTGGILALGFVKPKEHGSKEPAYTGTDMIEMYEKYGALIFPKSRMGKLGRVFRSEYPTTGLENMLEDYFGDARLKDALSTVVITSYDIENRMAFFFRSANARIARIQESYDYPMKSVARATSAAPTYFPPAKIPKGAPANEYWNLIDGGVFANNPAMCAYVEALNINPEAEICVVSLGTGVTTPTSYANKADKWGLVGWARPILTITMEGPGNTVDYQLTRLLDSRDYYRFQTSVDDHSAILDNTTSANIQRLKELAKQTVNEQNVRFEDACKKLMENKRF
jgi:patatin-like phospholipase/acyl hydrolase